MPLLLEDAFWSPKPEPTRRAPGAQHAAKQRALMAPPPAAAGAAPAAAAKGADTGASLARSTLAQLRPGAVRHDLCVPAQLLHPASALQLYGALPEAEKQLAAAAAAESPEERMLSVVAWLLACKRMPPYFKKPYNPVLGETHFVTVGGAWMLVEQVSHHPPISAFHLCHPGAGANLSAAEQPKPHFSGLSVDVVRDGIWTLTLDRWRETYHLNAPSLCMRLLPVPGVEWAGMVHVACAESGLDAKLDFHPRVMPGSQQHFVAGVISSSATGAVLHTLRGRWTDRITVKDRRTGAERVLFAAPPQNDPQASMTCVVPRPLPHDLEAAAYASSPAAVAVAAAIAAATGAAAPTLASHEVWSHLTAALHEHDWHAARDAKHAVEEAQRKARKVREDANIAWEPRFFEAHAERDGTWVLKADVAAALTAAVMQAPAEQVLPPPTPPTAVRRSADGTEG